MKHVPKYIFQKTRFIFIIKKSIAKTDKKISILSEILKSVSDVTMSFIHIITSKKEMYLEGMRKVLFSIQNL